MFPDSILASVNSWLKEANPGFSIINTFPVSGGSINSTYRLITSIGDYFLKYNLAETYPVMFESEAKGLEMLKATNSIYIPEVKLVGNSGKYSFILMQYVKESTKQKNYWETFAEQLARLHSVKHENYGLDHNNYIGSLPQDNHQDVDLINFLITKRLDPLVRKAIDAHLLNTSDQKHFDSLYIRLINEIPIEEPTLIHGDLWSGNLITESNGLPCLIDPAIYFGHRELDIAMTKLFGGFNEKFYSRYSEVFPLQPGWQGRVNLFQLYPLLVHVNLFGTSYVSQVRQIIKDF